jgi:hypothetical protein
MARMPFEWKLEGLIWNDPNISLFVRLKTLGVGGIFLVTLFFAVEKRVTGSKGFETKTIRTMARSVLLDY